MHPVSPSRPRPVPPVDRVAPKPAQAAVTPVTVVLDGTSWVEFGGTAVAAHRAARCGRGGSGPAGDPPQHTAGQRRGHRRHHTRRGQGARHPHGRPAREGPGGRLGVHPHPAQRRRGRPGRRRPRRAPDRRRRGTAADPAPHGLGRRQPRTGARALRLRGDGPAHRLRPRLRRHPGRHPVLRAGLDEGRRARRRRHRLEPGRPGDRARPRALRRLRGARRDRRQTLRGRTALHRLERVQGVLERRRGPLGPRGLHQAVQPGVPGAEEGRPGHHGRRSLPRDGQRRPPRARGVHGRHGPVGRPRPADRRRLPVLERAQGRRRLRRRGRLQLHPRRRAAARRVHGHREVHRRQPLGARADRRSAAVVGGVLRRTRRRRRRTRGLVRGPPGRRARHRADRAGRGRHHLRLLLEPGEREGHRLRRLSVDADGHRARRRRTAHVRPARAVRRGVPAGDPVPEGVRGRARSPGARHGRGDPRRQHPRPAHHREDRRQEDRAAGLRGQVARTRRHPTPPT